MTARGSFAGIDWASKEHALCVVDADGKILTTDLYPHSEAGIGRLIVTLEAYEARCVAIERPHGLLVDRLVEAGLEVFPINPATIKAMRRRYTGSGRKSDAFDAFCLAELVRTDSHRLRALVPDRDETRALRALVRAREEMIDHRVHLANQLRERLESFWPGPTKVFGDLASPVALAFLRLHPSPVEAAELDEGGLEDFLREHRSTNRPFAAGLLERLRAAPTVALGSRETEAHRMAVLGLVGLLEVDVTEIRMLTKKIVTATRVHPDGALFLSPFKGHALIVPAQLIIGFGDDRGRYPDAGILAAKAGVVPVAHQSGTDHRAYFRRACDRRLRQAIIELANATRRHNPWAKSIYVAARERGHRHNHALRILGRAWLRVLWRCWVDRVAYDPARHGARQRLEAEGSE
jgi:transposase